MDMDNNCALVSSDVEKVMAVVEASGLSKAKLDKVRAAVDELKLSMLSIIDSVDIKFTELDAKLKNQETSTDQLKKGRDDDSLLIKRLARDVSGLVLEKNKAACASVADNVMVFTKGATNIKAFLEDTISRGGGVSNAIITEIVNKDAKSKDHKMFKVKLDRSSKGALFKGLANGNHNKDFRVAHEIPYYLKKTFRDHEKVAYSMRTNFRENHLKTKISVFQATLLLRVKTRDHSEWMDLSDGRVSEYLNSPLIVDDRDPLRGLTCKEFLTEAKKKN